MRYAPDMIIPEIGQSRLPENDMQLFTTPKCIHTLNLEFLPKIIYKYALDKVILEP